MITDELRTEVKEAIKTILEAFDIFSEEDFYKSVEEEPDSGLYETLKAGVLEEFDISDEEMEELFDAVLCEM